MNRISRAFTDNKPLLGYVEGFGPVFEGDTYCIKHQELLTLGLEGEDSCAYCEWGDPSTAKYPMF